MITDKVSYNDPQSEITYYTYKRINHFNFLGARGTVKEINADSTTKYDGSATTTTGKLLTKPNFINQSPS